MWNWERKNKIETGERQLTDGEIDNGAVAKSTDLADAVPIYVIYKEYKINEPCKYGGFYREYVALKMLKKILIEKFIDIKLVSTGIQNTSFIRHDGSLWVCGFIKK